MVWQILGIPFGGIMSSAAVAVVLGAAELVWLDQQQKHRRLGFHFKGRPVRSCMSWKRYADDVVVGSRLFCCGCIFVFVRACCPAPQQQQQQHSEPRRGRWWVRTRESVARAHPVTPSLDSFHPRVLIVRSVAPE